MSKSESEIISAHKNTIEALTGKKCEIKLASKEEQLLKTMSLDQIKKAVEAINFNFPSILIEKREGELVNLRKIFCLFASYGNNNRAIALFLNLSYDQIRYYRRCCKNHLQNDQKFIKQYEQVKTILLSNS